jgi:hypothetical protein
MGALLNFIPDTDIIPTESDAVIERGLEDPEPKCYLAHEIGAGRWYAYIWGREVANFLDLGRRHLVVGNLHADTVEEVLETPGIDEENITRVKVLVFLRLDRQRGWRRRVGSVYENQGGRGKEAFRLLFRHRETRDGFQKVAESRLVGPADTRESRTLIERIIRKDLRTIEDVRTLIRSSLTSRA